MLNVSIWERMQIVTIWIRIFQISWSIVEILFEIKLWLTHHLVQWNICIRTEIHLHLFQSFVNDFWLNQSIPLQHVVRWNDSGTVLVHVYRNWVHQWYFFERFSSVAFHVHLITFFAAKLVQLIESTYQVVLIRR